jgi:hypothetical protein
MRVDTLLKSDSAVATMVAIDGGKIRLNSLNWDQPVVILAGEVFRVRSGASAAHTRRAGSSDPVQDAERKGLTRYSAQCDTVTGW